MRSKFKYLSPQELRLRLALCSEEGASEVVAGAEGTASDAEAWGWLGGGAGVSDS